MPTRLSVLGVRIPETAIRPRSVLPIALAAIGALALVEWYFQFDFSLGVLYTIPVLIVSAALNRWQVVLFGMFAALARAPFTPAASGLEFLLKFAMATIAYTGTGLLVAEMSINRRRLIDSFATLEREQQLRQRVEEQLRTLVESSPAAILTLNADAEVLAANRAAHDMLGQPAGSLIGQRIDASLPILDNALKVAPRDRLIRTSVTGWAKRADEQIFPIQAWFSVYNKGQGRCLAAIVVDMSEEVRDRERENFQHLLDYNRLLADAVSHEIRNFCSAISVVCSNLSARTDLRTNADFDALVRLVDGLLGLASFKLHHKSSGQAPRADLKAVLDQLRIVIEPDWEEIDGEVVWMVPDTLPLLAADAHGLLQIFLNLCQNSLRAVEMMPERRLTVSTTLTTEDVVVTFSDSGPGVANPERLFQLHPVPAENGGSGLGLYISRELARSFSGELQHEPTAIGGVFCVVIPVARATSTADAYAIPAGSVCRP